jgi:hypothetical protein
MNPNWMPGVAALMGLALAGPASADSRDIYQRGRGDHRYEAPASRIGFEKGYDDGLNRGRHDGDHRDRFDPRRDGKYRDGDHGYHSSYGPRYEYVRAYRTGFEQGYREGYAAYGRGGRDGYGRDGYGRDGYGRDDRYDPRR